MLRPIRDFISIVRRDQPEKNPREAYNLWAAEYDQQPGNLMLDLDEYIFSLLLQGVIVEGRVIADIGCGTGRHWPKILARRPASITGYDVSENMLEELAKKFPGSKTKKIDDNHFENEPSDFYDLITSTLTVAHIMDIAEAFASWARMLKPGGDMILTDYHPDLLSRGGKRTFSVAGRKLAVLNFIHPLSELELVLGELGFSHKRIIERRIDEQVKHFYAAKNALHIFEKYRNVPVIYGMHLRKS